MLRHEDILCSYCAPPLVPKHAGRCPAAQTRRHSIDVQVPKSKHRAQRIQGRQVSQWQSLCCSATTAESKEESEQAAKETVKFEEEQTPHSSVLVTITLPKSQTKKAWQRAVRKVGTSVDLPGFRKGKQIPEPVLLQRVSKADVVKEAVEILLTSSFPEIGERYRSRAYGESLQIVTTSDELVSKFDQDQPYTYQVSLDVEPKLSWKGDYKNIQVKVQRAGNDESDRVEVEKRLLAARKEKGDLRIVSGRGLQKGDVALIDFTARRTDSQEQIVGTEREGLHIDTGEPENSIGIPGIVDDMVGMTAGETRTIDQVVPDTWWENGLEEGLRGSKIQCDIQIRELFSWDLPELDDELAKQLLSGCSGVDNLLEQMAEAQRTLTAQETADAVNQALTLAVANIADVEVPQSMVRETALNEYQAQLLRAQTEGKLDRETIDQLATEEMFEKFLVTRREELTHMQKGVLGFDAIFKEEEMSISEQEVEQEAEAVLGEAAQSEKELDEEKLLAQVYEVLKATKVLEYLTDQSEITLLDPK